MKYRVVRRLGSGGFGNVYEVQASDGNTYAMKLLKDLGVINKQRFETEIKILAQLNHANIVKILEWNLGGDPPDFSPWYTMEYLGGGSLRDHMDDKFKDSYVFQRNWSINTVILPACHALTASLGQIGGTPGYCAPEQWFTFDMVDGRADIYSLGVILYEMMTGRMPPIYDQRDSSLKRSKAVDLPSKYHPTITKELDMCILKMLELEAVKRYRSVWQLISEIESFPDTRYYY